MRKKISKYLIIIVGIIIIGGCLGFIMFKTQFSSKIENLSEKDYILKNFNEINNIYLKDNLDEKSAYQHSKNSNLTCYKYIGPNMEDYIDKIREFYISPFDEYGFLFLAEEEKNKEQLYVCLPNSCKVKSLLDYEISEERDDVKFANIENVNYAMKKSNNQWKFLFPFVICE